MSWPIAILLALAAFGAVASLSGQPRAVWTVVLAALGFGLAGYALQASPNLAAAPKQSVREQTQEGAQFVALRAALIGEDHRSRSPYILMGDEWVRRGKYEGAATILRGIVHSNSGDGDAWLALANALLLQADGQFTPAALQSYRMAEQALPDSAAPPFFLGVGLIREGKLIEAHRMWSERVATLPEGSPGRELLAERLGALEQLMQQIVQESSATGQ
jgi:cytochrome c-type biogenesis protein CcmH